MSVLSNKKIGHIILGGSIGNLTEWYNILLYGYLASVISQLFFPVQDKLLSLTLTFTVFALSFFARPFGGLLLGWIGDVYGRQKALLLSLLLMAVPTFLIGCLPTYQEIGIASPLLLSILRLCQGLSAGGEHTGSAIYLAEYAPANRRAFWVSAVPASAALGILISSTASLLLIKSFSHEHLLSFGWRIGYWAGSLLCLASLLLRITLPETPYFQKTQQDQSHKQYAMSDLIRDKQTLKSLIIVCCLSSTWGIFYQILFIWMPTYLTHVRQLSNLSALKLNSFFMLCLVFLIPLVGYFTDCLQRKKLLITSCLVMVIFAWPLFFLLAKGTLQEIYFAMGAYTFIFSLYLPVAFVSMIEMFSTKIRYTGLSLGFNIGLAVFGGTCPLIATWLIAASNNNTSPGIYMLAAALIALLASFYVIEKQGQTIDH